MAVVSTYLAVWDLTSTRSPDWRNSFTPTEKQRRLTWGFENALNTCVVFLSPPHSGVDGEPGVSTNRFTGFSESSL